MDEYLAFAQKLARGGGKLIKDNFEADLEVEIKADHTPVTQVDKQINQLVIDAVKTTYPEHGLLGEEANHGTGQEALQWLCDPLDGTKAFILGMPQSTFILGLARESQLLLAVVYNPFTDRLYHAVKGQGAFCNDKPMQVNTQPLKDGYVLVDEAAAPLYGSLHKAGASLQPSGGAGYRCMILASGRVSAIVQGGADYHDIGPSSLIVEEAGGRVTAFDGSALRFDRKINGGIILSNAACHDDLVTLCSIS